MKTLNYFIYTIILASILLTSCTKDELKPAPVASFSMDKTSANVNEIIAFSNTSKEATSYLWNFGDGNTSTEKSPTHSYSTAGLYSITLTATGEGGENTASLSISISYPAPVASFIVDKLTAKKGEAITFTNTSVNASSYEWNFGDGITSTVQNPTHSYSSSGIFQIKLTAIGLGGSDLKAQNIEITVPPFNIVPGARIGNFVLGKDLGTLLGFITETYAQHLSILMTNGKYTHLLMYKQTGIGFFFTSNSATLYKSDISNGIYAFAPFQGNTEKGITFGSLLSEVQNGYGIPESITSLGSYSYAKKLGIEFWADDAKTKVDEIYISAPTGKKSTANEYDVNLKSLLNSDFEIVTNQFK